jgi:Tfp pilus assembly protein PilF
MALVHLGTCLIARDRAEQAEKPLNTALQIDPTHSDAWYQRGLLYLNFGRLEDSMHDFENAAENDEHHIDARLKIASLLHESEDKKGAIAAWRKVLDVDPEHRLARRRLEECRESPGPPKPNPQAEG